MPVSKVVFQLQQRTLRVGLAATVLFAQILPAHAGGVNILSGKGGGGGAAPAAAASQAAAQQGAAAAQQAAQHSVNALTKASQAIQAMRAAQSAARSLAIQAPTNVTNGLSPGGLVVDPRVGTDPSLWVNASKPTQQVTNGQVTVTIEQQAQKALLTWQQFNVGRETTVHFDQSKGNAASGNNWVALNRINATGAPSQILGQIKAEGTVLLINPNGIIFNGASQVNVGSLIASSASIDPAAFMSTGIYSTQSGGSYLPSFTNAGGKISVEAGAEITTAAPKSVTSGGGYVMLMGTEVSNSGSISTPKGQALLSAGDSFILRSGYSTTSNQFSTTRGTEISPVIAVGSAAGKVTNAGLIFAQQGDITLAGHDVTQGGILVATTSVNQRGTIHLLNAMSDTTGSVTLTGSAITAILPELDSKDTALDSQRDALIAASAAQNLLRAQAMFGQFDNLSTLADRLDQSRVEIVTGGNAVFGGGSYTAAQGGQVAVQAGKRIFTETGAALDVSGVRNVALAMGSNNISINVQGNELRDSPQNRDSGYLANENVWIDVRNLTLVPAGTGGYASDRYYTPGGLLEVGGYLGNTAHSIGEWTAVGGTITLSAPEVVAQKGSIFNLSGGSVAYQGGYIRTTNFLGADGRLYNIGDNAPADMKYYGVGEGFIRDHAHWGQTEVWMNPFGLNRDSYRWEDGYTVGRDAGRLVLSTPTSVFEGDILASVIQGERQINARPTDLTDGYKATQNTAALAGQLAVGAYGSVGRADAYASDVRIGEIAGVTSGLGATDALDSSRANTVWFDAGHLNEQKLGGIDIATRDTITIDRDLTLANGGALNLTAPIIDINANIAARGGSIIASNQLATNEAQSTSVLTRITDLAPGSGTSGVTLRANKTIDMGGVWTNAQLDPNDLSGLAFINGGGVTLRSTGDVTLENGSLVDASSGGAILATGKTQGGKGGDVSLLAGYNGSSGALTLNGAIAGYGAKGGGVLSLSTGGLVVIGDANSALGSALHIDNRFLSSGFSKYSINGQGGLLVPEEAVVSPVMPIFEFTAAAYSAHTGSDASKALGLWLPDTFMADPIKATLTQRGGVDLELYSGGRTVGSDMLRGGSVTIGRGASITVDPGRKIEIASGGQITVDGNITAHGGEIAILNRALRVTEDPGGLSVWLGEHARLDASARAVWATDVQGRNYGVVPDGGTVVLGSRGGDDPERGNLYQSTEAFVILRKGAIVDVSGTRADLDLLTYGQSGQSVSTRRTVASNGGSIVLASYQGIYNDGTLLGAAGGAGASGGTLALALEAPVLILPPPGEEKPARLMGGRALHITQARQPSVLPEDLSAGAANDDLKLGYAALSADEVTAGGFEALSLFARTAIVFDSNVNLSTGRSIELKTSGLYSSIAGGRATVSAPYVTIDGQFVSNTGSNGIIPSRLPNYPSSGTITVQGQLIDVVNRLSVNADKLTLDSSGDLRFLSSTTTPAGDFYDDWTVLGVFGDLELIARRIYPETDAKVQLYAGTAIDGGGSPTINLYASANTGSVTIGKHGDGAVAAPYSVFGQIRINAGTILQGGNLFAPFGGISLTATTPLSADLQTRDTLGLVEFLPGSLTSVSGAGLVMPYGGTRDGVKFTVNGTEPLSYDLLTGTIARDANGNYVSNSNSGRLGVTVTGNSVVSHEGSVIDLSAGGQLLGAGFVSGRGGSVDVLVNPLIASNPALSYSASGNKVYAIVPGIATAPSEASYYSAWTGATPDIGEQIAVPAGVPGLAAGTYTLLPANYALLPGAFRVELGARGTTGSAEAIAAANGSYVTSVTRNVAGTAINDVLFTSAIITPGKAVRTYSQFNEQGYEAFQRSRAATFGSVRPLQSVDGKFLTINLNALAAGSPSRIESALRFDGEAMFTPGENGYGGTLSISAGETNSAYQTDLIITGQGSTTARNESVITVASTDIEKIGAPNLYLGGAPGKGYTQDSPVFVLNGGMVRTLTLENGVDLTGSQVILSALGNVKLESGASISTLGRGLLAPDTAATGFLFNAATILVVSNGSISLNPNNTSTSVTLENDTSLFSEGTIAFGAGTGVSIGDDVRFGTRDLQLAIPNINVGTAASLAAAAGAGILPGGLSLTQETLDRLFRGDPVTGSPGMKNLILSAANSFNFYGSVNLSTLDQKGKSLLDSFVISTPAIYGYGSGTDSVTLATDRLVWSSRAVYAGADNSGAAIYKAATPGAIIPNGPGTGRGIFNVNAREILFGYPEHSQPQNTIQFDRLMLGFKTVNLNASERITSNNTNTLSVWRTGDSPTSSFDPLTYRGEAANLNIVTPLLTGESGSALSIYNGGMIRLLTPEGAAPAKTSSVQTLGAAINLNSIYETVVIDSSVALPSGKLTAIAKKNIQVERNAVIDLSGREIPFNDVTKYSWGGDVVLESGTLGSTFIYDGAIFDVSAINNDAGSIGIVAPGLDANGGIVFVDWKNGGTMLSSFDGMFKGTTTGGYRSGSFKLSTQSFPGLGSDVGFASLNRALNAGGFFETRDFAIKSGDLTIGDDVKAHNVIVSVDGGSLTVNGRIDASGAAPGSIRLSAKNNLTLASTAMLDTHSTVLQTDSYGAPVEAKNRGHIELTAKGRLRLNEGATFDLTSPDGKARSDVVLNVPRIGTGFFAGDMAIDAGRPVTIKGASSVAVYGVATYSPTDTAGTIVQDNGSSSPTNAQGELGLSQLYNFSDYFTANAWQNADLQNRLAGLKAYDQAFHLRAGIEIIGGSASNGDLTIKGDLDLSQMRTSDKNFDPVEPVSLVVRAARNLTINGSVSDGFASRPGIPPVISPLGTPNNLSEFDYYSDLDAYTRWGTYNVSRAIVQAWTIPNTPLYQLVMDELGRVLRDKAGNIYGPGQTVPANTLIDTSLDIYFDAHAPLPIWGAVVSTGTPDAPATSAAAPMLTAGSQSASIRLISGADIASANTRAVLTLTQLGAGGNMLLAKSQSSLQAPPRVIRTGTGNLDLIAGRDLTEESPYGVYTAGTQMDVGSAYSGITSQGGYFTEDGGDVLISAGRNLTGSIWQTNINTTGLNNYSVGNWLVRQGDATTPAAWGIRFGNYVGSEFYGFAGFGTLGGGNLAVKAGRNAGAFAQPVTEDYSTYTSSGLVLAVGSSGRVTSVSKTAGGSVTGGTLMQTGGGDLTFDVGGRLNPIPTATDAAFDDFYGSLTNVRGDISVRSGAIGSAMLMYGISAPNDPRPTETYTATTLRLNGGVGGPVVVIGDGSANLQSRGDLVLGGVGDPGLIFARAANGPSFSLWQPDTTISLLSLGGNMVPLNTAGTLGANERWGTEASGTSRSMLPPIFEAVAAHGNLYTSGSTRIELAPSTNGYLELLAGDSIYSAAIPMGQSLVGSTSPTWSVSGANADANSIPNPFRPGTSNSYFQFASDTVTSNLHEGDDKVIRVYALTGDIVNFTLGTPAPVYVNDYEPRYAAAMPARIIAGRDIVNFGKNAYQSNFGDQQFLDLPSLILNNDPTDVSVIQAGRDILYAQVQIAGPGSLEVKAGRNLYLGDKGSIVSIGALATGDTRPGASILMQAGAGKGGPNYAGLLPYLDADNLAVVGTPLVDQPGKVAKTYEKELKAWLKERFGYQAASDEAARDYFGKLPSEQQAIFLRQVYFAELKEGGREYNDARSSRYGSYLRGRYAIEALFPEKDAGGNPIAYLGNITMFGGSGVRTQFGGDIEMLTPGGQQVVGVEGLVPPASSGIVTQGSGNISLYSKGSILLGLSRVMTTYGGNVVAWSAEGDINAGRGAKTTVVYTPPKRIYDGYGHVTLSPVAPSSGAGIATLNPIPEVPPGDIDLIAPLGTIDAGEAGIRVSGNVNLAALQIVNAANIQVQGSTSGIPVVQPPNISGLTQATTVASATTKDTAPVGQGAGTEQPSIIIVEVVGYGGGDDSSPSKEDSQHKDNKKQSYNTHSAVQYLGHGPKTSDQKKSLLEQAGAR